MPRLEGNTDITKRDVNERPFIETISELPYDRTEVFARIEPLPKAGITERYEKGIPFEKTVRYVQTVRAKLLIERLLIVQIELIPERSSAVTQVIEQ